MNIINNDRMTKVISVILAVVFGVLLISLVVNAASTISTNIETGGTLSVTGASTLTGLTSMIQASSTRFSVHDTAYFGGSATSTFDSAGNLAVIGTLGVTGVSTLTGRTDMIQASSTRFSVHDTAYFGGSATTTIASDGTLTVPVGKTTTLTTSNSATSTLIAGCMQTYATSTLTPIHLTFATANMATTSSQSGTGGDAATGLSTGVVLWKYGACPI